MEVDGESLDFPLHWKTRWDLIGYDREWEEREQQERECAGAGNCHGCLQWCAFCGDVGEVCHVFEWPACCDAHGHYPDPPLGPDPNQLVLFE